MIIPSAKKNFPSAPWCGDVATCTETSVLDILWKFRRYGKMKGTLRRSNLAKESVYQLFIDHGHALILHIRRCSVTKTQKMPKKTLFCGIILLPEEIAHG